MVCEEVHIVHTPVDLLMAGLYVYACTPFMCKTDHALLLEASISQLHFSHSLYLAQAHLPGLRSHWSFTEALIAMGYWTMLYWVAGLHRSVSSMGIRVKCQIL